MKSLKAAIASIPVLAFTGSYALAEPKVVASIKPIHSLVSAVMEGVAEPSLIVEGANSPHDYALKPSQAASLQDADIVFWIGHEFEQFLEKPLENIAADAHAISLLDVKGIEKLDFREGALFEEDEHHDHGHGSEDKDHDDHAGHKDHDEHKHDEHAGEDGHKDHDDHDEHKHDEHVGEDGHKDDDHDAHDDHDHDKHKEQAGHEGHGHGAHDPHIWLDPENAKVILKAIVEELSEHDSDNAAKYAANSEAFIKKLDVKVAELQATIAPLKGKKFIVFHDAYHYFEHHFDIEASGAISVNPEVAPSAKRVREIQDRLRSEKITCAFSEPQFSDAVIKTVIDGTETKTGLIDPLGANIEDGPELYIELLSNIGKSMNGCLG